MGPSKTMVTEIGVEEIPAVEEVVEEAPPPLHIDVSPDYYIDDLFHQIFNLGASDLHLAVGAPPVFRIKGDMNFTDLPLLEQKFMEKILYPIITADQREQFEKTGNIDFAHEVPGLARFRGNYMRQYNGMTAVFRIIPSKIPTVEELGLPPILNKIALYKRGLVIVTGPTGSGKSTTLAAMINHINENRSAHIITIEDPIEFTHQSKKCLIDHREVGHHATSFADALRAAVREDPDIILVGEMRDLETISLAIKAAETGLLVFGTLHTNSAAKTVDRIIDVFPAKQQEQIRSMLSESLKSVVAQQLLKTADGKGRVASIEILIATMGLGNLIREGKTSQISTIIQMGRSDGMQTMDMHLVELVKAGKITVGVAEERALDKTVFQRSGIQM